MLRFAAVPLAVCACWVVGCLNDSSSSATTVVPTLLTIDPTALLGAVRCSETELRRYVVTLTDVTVSPNMQLPSSAPVDCSEFTSFGQPAEQASVVVGVQPDHFYIGVVDGYDRTDLAPEAAGSRAQTSAADPTAVVPPRWTTTCGQPPASQADASANPLLPPTEVVASAEVFLHGCVPFNNAAPTDVEGGEAAADAADEPTSEAGADEGIDSPPDGGSEDGTVPGD